MMVRGSPCAPQAEGGVNVGANLSHRPAQRWGVQSTGSMVTGAASAEREMLGKPVSLARVKGAKSIYGGGSLLFYL